MSGNARASIRPDLNPPDMKLGVAFPREAQPNTPVGSCCVYFMWSADWHLIYIGVTDNPSRRFSEHRKQKPWWRTVHHMEIEQYDSRARALAREREVIGGWNPIHNIVRPRATR